MAVMLVQQQHKAILKKLKKKWRKLASASLQRFHGRYYAMDRDKRGNVSKNPIVQWLMAKVQHIQIRMKLVVGFL